MLVSPTRPQTIIAANESLPSQGAGFLIMCHDYIHISCGTHRRRRLAAQPAIVIYIIELPHGPGRHRRHGPRVGRRRPGRDRARPRQARTAGWQGGASPRIRNAEHHSGHKSHGLNWEPDFVDVAKLDHMQSRVPTHIYASPQPPALDHFAERCLTVFIENNDNYNASAMHGNL